MDDTAPATKGDLSKLERATNQSLQALEQRIMQYMDSKTEETKRHFDVVAENLKHDFRGIHKDKISVLEDRSKDHGERLAVMEKQLAI
jgi:hypothetical protein